MTPTNPVRSAPPKTSGTLTRAWRAARGARSGIVLHDGACQSGSACGRWGRCGGGLQRESKKKKREREGRVQKKSLAFKKEISKSYNKAR